MAKLEEKYLALPVDQVAPEVVIVTGVTRSGTTFLGKLLSSLKSVEYEYEPWLSRCLPIIAQAGLVEKDFAPKFMRKYVNEMTITRLLGRNLNLRKTDESCALNVMTEAELERRWRTPPKRGDIIDQARRSGTIFMMKMTNLHPYYEFLVDSFENLRLIHIVRNGLDVASSINKKEWYSEERLRSPEYFNLSKLVSDSAAGREYLVPFHIPPEEARAFVDATPFAKGLLSWCVLLERNERELKRLRLNEKQYLEVRYEDLLQDPDQVLEKVCRFIGSSVTPFTQAILKTLQKEQLTKKRSYPLEECGPVLLERAQKILEKHGYAGSLAGIR